VAKCLDEGMVLCKERSGKRVDIKDIFQRPVKLHFGIKRLACIMNDEPKATLVAFNVGCSFIGTKDLVPEHLAFNVWSL
jgi:hypothetical protein